MLFWIALIISAVCIFFAIFSFKTDHENLCFASGLCSAAMVFISILMIVTVINTHVTADAKESESNQIYESLIFESQSVELRDEFGITNKEYIDDVKEWNAELAEYKNICHNFWVGIFYANYYDNLQYIDLDSIVFNTVAEVSLEE